MAEIPNWIFDLGAPEGRDNVILVNISVPDVSPYWIDIAVSEILPRTIQAIFLKLGRTLHDFYNCRKQSPGGFAKKKKSL